MKHLSIAAIAFCVIALTATLGSKRAVLERNTQIALAKTVIDLEPTQSCWDGSISSSGCPDNNIQIALGNECPAASGEYCSDEFPYCCGTPGNYYCATDVNSC